MTGVSGFAAVNVKAAASESPRERKSIHFDYAVRVDFGKCDVTPSLVNRVRDRTQY
jgi:hypothetical protein